MARKHTRVLVTRPEKQNANLILQLNKLGYVPVPLPLILTEAITSSDFSNLVDFDLVIFTSRNAVMYCQQDASCAFLFSLPSSTKICAIGEATAEALTDAGVSQVFAGEGGFTSEDLLMHPALKDVNHKSALIIKGKGGRKTLGETLAQRGASVSRHSVYQRVPVNFESSKLLEIVGSDKFSVALITSVEILDYYIATLAKIIPDLFYLPIIVGSPRIMEHAYAQGFKEVLLAKNPSDRAMCETVLQNFPN